MGFGKKTDYPTGRVLDLDKSYRYIIKPAAEAAGCECRRADEIQHTGYINVPMYQELLSADVVIADVSTYNPTAFYELGVRHALKPFATITIAEDKMVFPFDIGQIAIRTYHHLGEGMDFGEVERMRSELGKAIEIALAGHLPDSPVYAFLPNLRPPELSSAPPILPIPPITFFPEARPDANPKETIASLMERSEEAIKNEDWEMAVRLLTEVRSGKDTADPRVLQRLALATYRSRKPTQQQAIEDARDILSTLAPETLNDPEVLSVWGAIHARRWELVADRGALDTAIGAYQKAFQLRANYHDGIVLAFLLNARATMSEAAEGIADFVGAQRVRREVAGICSRTLEESLDRNRQLDEYAIRAALAEAWFGLGEVMKYEAELRRANPVAPHSSLREVSQDRIARLGMLLEFSPIGHLASV
jgi:hypothetical protein